MLLGTLAGCDRALPGVAVEHWEAAGPEAAPLAAPSALPSLALRPIDAPIVRTDGTTQALWLRARVSPRGLRDPVVLVPRAYVALDAWVDGERVLRTSSYREASGVPFRFVPLPRSEGDVEVVLRVASRYTQVGLPEGARVGERAELLAALVRRDAPRTALAVSALAIGLGALAFVLRGRERRALVGIAIFSIGMGGWSLFQTRARQIWMPDLSLWFGIWWCTGSFTSFGAATFVEAVFDAGPRRFVRVLRWLFAAHTAICVASLALDEGFFAIAPFVFLSGRALIVVGSALTLAWTAHLARSGDRAARRFLAGFGVASVGIAHDIAVSFGLLRTGMLLADVGYLGMQLSWITIVVLQFERLERAVAEQAAALARFVHERDALVRDLHDGLGGVVTNVRLLAERAQSAEATPPTGLLTAIVGLADEGLDELRILMSGFDALPSTWRGAAAELRRAASATLEPHAIALRFEPDPGEGMPDLATFVALARIQREALTNVVKHAHARSVTSRFRVRPTELELSIDDDGPGPSGATPAAGHGRGLDSMRIRAKGIGATVRFEREGDRTRLVVRREGPAPRPPERAA